MSYKWIGAILVVIGCGSCGFTVAASCRREVTLLNQLLVLLDYMECELQYRLTPLPTLCRQTGIAAKGILQNVFLRLSEELEEQIAPDVSSCMKKAIESHDLPRSVLLIMKQLGYSLGRFDLPGQLQGLESVRNTCRQELVKCNGNKEEQMRSYQTLSICAGAALAILFS